MNGRLCGLLISIYMGDYGVYLFYIYTLSLFYPPRILDLFFSTEVILVSLLSPSIYLRVSLDKLQGNFEQILGGFQGNLDFLGRWWCAHLVVSFSLGRGERCLETSFHALRIPGCLQTHQKPLPDVGVLVILGLRPAVLAAHLFRDVQGQASGAPGRWELHTVCRRWRTAQPW